MDFASLNNRISKVAPVNYQDGEGESPLMIAAAHGHMEIMKELLAAAADPNLRNRWGDTALIKAIEKEHDEAALLLLSSGARVNVKGYFGQTALLVETRKGSEPRDRRRLNGEAPVVRQPSSTIVKALLDRGADINLSG